MDRFRLIYFYTMRIFPSLFFLLFLFSCEVRKSAEFNTNFSSLFSKNVSQQTSIINPEGKTVKARILPPMGFQRVSAAENSFSAYLRQVPLKPHGSKVRYYDGREKDNYNVYIAVADLKIGKKDLHQCADAVMRLRAEYLYSIKAYDQIHFNFTNGFRADYTEWIKGKRISVKGNNCSWVKSAAASNTYNDFWNFLEMVFTYAGTLSLEKELDPVNINDIRSGDVFIKGGSPGHAVIVMDVAKESSTGKTLFLLAQSYMPAQELQLLTNPNNPAISPWYSTDFSGLLETPEWTFRKQDLRRFKEQ
ncbi:MAG: DUF4846 domain-containing protein [Cytophagaceae bacterium]